MSEQEKPIDISSVDPTFGMSEEQAAEAKQAAKSRHPAFNDDVYKELAKMRQTRSINDEFTSADTPEHRRRILSGGVQNVVVEFVNEEADDSGPAL